MNVMVMFERQFSFSAFVGLKTEGVLPVVIRTPIPVHPDADRWWGVFTVDRTTATTLDAGNEVSIIDQKGAEHPAIIVWREGNDVSFRCRSAFPVPTGASRHATRSTRASA